MVARKMEGDEKIKRHLFALIIVGMRSCPRKGHLLLAIRAPLLPALRNLVDLLNVVWLEACSKCARTDPDRGHICAPLGILKRCI
jgi:hypothetical protein